MTEKTEFSSKRMFELSDDEGTSVIVKVKKADYVPPGFNVRARIDAYMFTADTNGAAVRQAQADLEVESISFAQRLK
jgi:hypothetical protein